MKFEALLNFTVDTKTFNKPFTYIVDWEIEKKVRELKPVIYAGAFYREIKEFKEDKKEEVVVDVVETINEPETEKVNEENLDNLSRKELVKLYKVKFGKNPFNWLNKEKLIAKLTD